MTPAHLSNRGQRKRIVQAATAALLTAMHFAGSAWACPFCTALKPTLAQIRERSAVVALTEIETQLPSKKYRLKVHRVLSGESRIKAGETLELSLDAALKPGGLALLFGSGGPDARRSELDWEVVAVNETSYGYFARSPSLATPAAERLRYFAPFLEHADPLVADDAYLEFGHAPFDLVAQASDSLPSDRLRGWLADPKVPVDRKGFYGLALGLATTADQRQANAAYLREAMLKPANDFRSGFDGVLGGYLLLGGVEALDLVDSRYLANPQAADGDTRHALTALRFYHEYGRQIPIERQRQALRHLLDRPEFAVEAITDLARWSDWEPLERIASLYANPEYRQPATGQVVVGYLLACPAPHAAEALEKLRQQDPKGVATAEQVVRRTGSLPGGN